MNTTTRLIRTRLNPPCIVFNNAGLFLWIRQWRRIRTGPRKGQRKYFYAKKAILPTHETLQNWSKWSNTK